MLDLLFEVMLFEMWFLFLSKLYHPLNYGIGTLSPTIHSAELLNQEIQEKHHLKFISNYEVESTILKFKR